MASQLSLFQPPKKPKRNKRLLYAEQQLEAARLVLASPNEGPDSARVRWARAVVEQQEVEQQEGRS